MREVLTAAHFRDAENPQLVIELPLPAAPTRAFLEEAAEVVLGYLRSLTYEWQLHDISPDDLAESLGEASVRLLELAELLPAAPLDSAHGLDYRGFGRLE